MDDINTVNTSTNEPVRKTETVSADTGEFSYDGYQVVREEFFAHLFEPSVTFNNEKVSVNTACIRKLPHTEYVQFLVNPTEKKLAVKPCSEDTKDSLRWATTQADGKRHPKSITCRIFFAKVMKLMDWDPYCRYQILGKPVRSNGETVFVFDLTGAKTYQKKNVNGENISRKALYPEEWKEQFGLPAHEHQDRVLINIFDDYAVFKIDREEEAKGYVSNNNDNPGSEEESHQDLQINA
ncbi:MAG: integrase [Lachnospiraceae bacterium]|nr:integrase [Lachnospiraceae bacterium]